MTLRIIRINIRGFIEYYWFYGKEITNDMTDLRTFSWFRGKTEIRIMRMKVTGTEIQIIGVTIKNPKHAKWTIINKNLRNKNL